MYYQFSKQLVDIVKPMVQYEFQQGKNLEVVQSNSNDNSVTNTPECVQGNQYQTYIVTRN
jgi:hypothetical protein